MDTSRLFVALTVSAVSVLYADDAQTATQKLMNERADQIIAAPKSTQASPDNYVRDCKLLFSTGDDRFIVATGETVTFTAAVAGGDGQVMKDCGDYYFITKYQDGEPKTEEYVPVAGNNPLKLPFLRKEPGEVFLEIKLAKKRTPEERRLDRHHREYAFLSVVNEKGATNEIRRGGSAIWGAERLQPGGKEPADFDAFWAEQKRRDMELPFEVKENKQVRVSKTGVRMFSLVLNSLGGDVHAEYSLPQGSETNLVKKPLWVIFQPYGVAAWRVWPWEGFVSLAINSHDMDNYGTSEYYAAMGKKFARYGFIEEENKKAETCYFYGMFMRDYRAVRWVKENIKEWDGTNVYFYGGSQGGYQSAVMAGLMPDTTQIDVECPWAVDMGGTELGRFSQFLWRPKWAPGIAYFEPCFHIKRARLRKFTVTKAGAGDVACQASGIIALYNSVPEGTKKSFTLYQEFGHGWGHDLTHPKYVFSNKPKPSEKTVSGAAGK